MEHLDPITFQVICSSLSGIAAEMQTIVHRTGFSTIIRESQDSSCAILTRQGKVVGQHVILPLHMGAFPACVEAILRRYPQGEMAEGDAFLVNHPYEGGSPHAPDMAVVTPAFYQGELVAFCCGMAHKSDIGGVTPGSCSGQAREIFHEGLHLPAVKYMDRYRVNREVEAILRANSRTPELVVGDINGQVGADRIGEERLKRLMDRYGKAVVLSAFELLFDKTEERLRLELASWRDGIFEAEGFLDSDGVELDRRVRLHVRVDKQGDRIGFDFSGCDPQTKGPANIRPPLVRACCYYCLIAMIDPHLPNNEGLARVVETRFAEGTVVHPKPPAPLNCYMATAAMVNELILKCLSEMVPGRSLACGGSGGALVFGGRTTKTGRSYVQYEILGAGYGGSEGKDGEAAISAHLGNCKIAPVEILEAEFPIRVTRFDLIQDSGGAGRFRGGLGMRREYLILEEEARFGLRGDKHEVPAWGIKGGKAGGLGACIVNPERPEERRLPSRSGEVLLRPGDVVRLERAGGGGYGSPLERDPQRVLEDVLDGYVSLEAARRDYGVVIDPAAMAVAAEATRACREA